jgi:rhodanese-related sulfurtransferase
MCLQSLLRARWETLPRDRAIVMHCRSGFRAHGHLAVRMLRERGFAEVANPAGGFVSMVREGGLV